MNLLLKIIFGTQREERSSIEQLKLALKFKIKTVDFRGVECYALSWKLNSKILATYYIDKTTLMKMGFEAISKNKINTEIYEIEYDTQTEDDFSIKELQKEYREIN